jgi:hypothetical protein
LTAADLLAAESRAEDLGAEEKACAFLREALRDGPRTAREITAGARDSGMMTLPGVGIDAPTRTSLSGTK